MAWIESHQAIKDHPKTRKLARLLEVSVPTAIGHLHCLWWWALDYAPDGNLESLEGVDIATGALWEGDPDLFIASMSTAGFIDYLEDSPVIHDWMEYAGKLIDRRKANSERKRQARAGVSPGRLTDVPETSHGHPKDVLRTSEATEPNSTEPTVPTEPTSSDEELPGGGGQKFEYPVWFEPLVALKGFKNIAHLRSIKSISEGCEEAGVKTATVVSSFAEYYRDGGRSTHNWTDPVQALVRTLGVQIRKVRNGPSIKGSQPDQSAQEDPVAKHIAAAEEIAARRAER